MDRFSAQNRYIKAVLAHAVVIAKELGGWNWNLSQQCRRHPSRHGSSLGPQVAKAHVPPVARVGLRAAQRAAYKNTHSKKHTQPQTWT
jgi:hypothetical protein